MARKKLSAFEKDILTEVGSICVGNVTIALEQMLSRRIELELPSLQIVGVEELPRVLGGQPEDIIVGLHTRIFGGARGNALLVFPKSDAYSVLDLIMGTSVETTSALTELAISALKEMGNIVIASYLSALSKFVGLTAIPSTVNFTSGSIDSLTNMAFSGFEKEEDLEMIIVEAVLRESDKNLSGRFFMIFDTATIKEILSSAKKMVHGEEEQKT